MLQKSLSAVKSAKPGHKWGAGISVATIAGAFYLVAEIVSLLDPYFVTENEMRQHNESLATIHATMDTKNTEQDGRIDILDQESLERRFDSLIARVQDGHTLSAQEQRDLCTLALIFNQAAPGCAN